MINVNKDEREKRYAICKDCPEYGISPLIMAKDKCKQCGCIMAIKTWIKPASCPLNKW